MYDAAIVGTGPAGLSAALTLKLNNKNILWLGSPRICEKVRKAPQVDNYPGLPAIRGEELADAFQKHADEMGLEVQDHMVNNIIPMGGSYALMAESEFYEAKTVILTTGVAVTAVLPGEERLLGHGVSYCATCDGMLYRGKTIAVICNAARLEHEVRYLAEIAGKVYYFPLYKTEETFDAPNLEVMTARPRGIEGDKHVEAVLCTDGTSLDVSGVFCLRTSVSLNALLSDVEREDGHIKVDRHQATNLPGIFAAGDCTGRPYQYTKAVGEGNVAAHSVVEYLDAEEYK